MEFTRRQLLGSAAGLAATSLAAPPLLAQSGTTEITFAFAPDESGAVQALIDGFNASNEQGIAVKWLKAPEDTDDFFRYLVSEFEAEAGEIDVFGADVIWTAELAARGWTQDVSRRLRAELDPDAFLPVPLAATYAQNRYWAVPWYTDAGMIYYRRDLLEEAGIEPPRTWDELIAAAQQITEGGGPEHGLVLQGARYEGGTATALEFIWSAGGRAWSPQASNAGTFGMNMVDDNIIVLNSADSIAGLAKAREMVASGLIPEAAANWNERDALAVFAAGGAVFMRNWPFAYGVIGTEGYNGISQEQVGVIPIPTLRAGAPSFACLGGWNMAIPSDSANDDAAWAFIRYALDPAQQRAMAEQGGFLPVRSALYEDDALTGAVPMLSLGRSAVETARARPSSVIYSDLSPRISNMFNRVLTGDLEPEEAVRRTADELQRIVTNAG
ncbi:ABC transporter substrate-binding protein [Paracoccaceae bacterium GXU_MW_L88]